MRGFARFFLPGQVRPYVILFIERDGSTYLTSLLTSHPDVQAVYERFAVLKQKGEGAKEQLDWLRAYFTPPLISRKAALGFKTKLVDVIDLDGFTRVLREKGVSIIQMKRGNRVKAVVSRMNAARLHDKSGNWNLYKEEDRLPPMQVDPQIFAQYLQEREEADQQLDQYVASLMLPTLCITYEELLTSRDDVLNRVFAFLKVRPMVLEGKTLKNTSDDLRDVVLNFDVLKQAYQGTVYEPMFDEVLVPSAV